MPSSRKKHFIKKGFQADMVVVCQARPMELSDDDWLVKSLGKAGNKSTRVVVLLTQGQTDAEDVKKCMEQDVTYPVTVFPNMERRQQEREMFGVAYPVLEDAKTQMFKDMRKLPKKVMDRVEGLLRPSIVEKLIKRDAQLYVRAKAPKPKK